MNWKYILGFIVLLLLVVFALDSCTQKSNNINFTHKIEEKGGVIIEIDRKVWDHGPFWYKSKGKDIYEITYEVDGVKKTAWVRTGTFKNDWRWEE